MTPLEAEGDTGTKGIVTDHAYEPRDAWWWSLCRTCGLGEAAHRDTTLTRSRPTGPDLYCSGCGIRLADNEHDVCHECAEAEATA